MMIFSALRATSVHFVPTFTSCPDCRFIAAPSSALFISSFCVTLRFISSQHSRRWAPSSLHPPSAPFIIHLPPAIPHTLSERTNCARFAFWKRHQGIHLHLQFAVRNLELHFVLGQSQTSRGHCHRSLFNFIRIHFFSLRLASHASCDRWFVRYYFDTKYSPFRLLVFFFFVALLSYCQCVHLHLL